MVEGDEFLGFLRWWARATAAEASSASLCSGGECGVVVKRDMGMGAAEIEGERERKREMNTMQSIVFEAVFMSDLMKKCGGRYSY